MSLGHPCDDIWEACSTLPVTTKPKGTLKKRPIPLGNGRTGSMDKRRW